LIGLELAVLNRKSGSGPEYTGVHNGRPKLANQVSYFWGWLTLL
jgi:hypothetical protein